MKAGMPPTFIAIRSNPGTDRATLRRSVITSFGSTESSTPIRTPATATAWTIRVCDQSDASWLRERQRTGREWWRTHS